jgi:hypothetical protein
MRGNTEGNIAMTLVAANARIFGGESDSIFLAPFGTPLPGGIDNALDGAFEDVGWLHSDGVTETLSGSKERVRGHQGQGVVRTRMSEPGTELAFHALETKAQTQGLRYDEKSVSTAGGTRYALRGPGQKVSVRTAVIDFYDADDETVKERLEIPRFEVVANGDRVYVGTDIAGFPFLGEIIGDYGHYASNPTPKTTWTLNILGAPTGGTYTLQVNGYATAPIAHNATSSAIQSALNAISGVTGHSGVVVTGTAPGPFSIVFGGAVSLEATSALTGGSTPAADVA